MIIALSIIFKKIRWIILPVLCCTFAAISMMGLLGLFGWEVTVISSNFISLQLIITMAITIHLIVRYRELHFNNPETEHRKLVLDAVCLMLKPCLYAALTTINSTDVNIITVEDPIEYRIGGIGQVQVNPKINLTFASGLRSIVRQDPDVILVGEIRDTETAEIAIQSALTGHLVFSTIHTNDSASAVTRLRDMGIESFLISSSVNAILAQRLVRIICNDCREEYLPDVEELKKLGISPVEAEGRKVYHGRGCSKCNNTGYRGRKGIFELMLLDKEMKNLILYF